MTVDEINAGFDAANHSLQRLTATLVPDQNIPFVGNLRTIAAEKLQSPEGRQVILEEVKNILAAAEAVRAKGHSFRPEPNPGWNHDTS